MKRLGLMSPLSFADADGNFPEPHLGAHVAIMELLKNIVTHGGYDRFDFLLGLGGHSRGEASEYIDRQNWDPRQILIYDGRLPLEKLECNKYHTLYLPGPDIHTVLAMRHALGSPLAPVTAVNHTMSYRGMMPLWLELLLGHVLPCDAIVCTSRASREAIAMSMEVLAERLSTQLGAKIPPFRGQIRIIPLGVDVKFWHPETDETKARGKKDLALPEKSCLIFCPGRFSTGDKMDLRPFLIAIHRLLPALSPDNVNVALVGDDRGNESELIQRFVNKLGLGHVVRIDTNGNPSNIRQYYRAADIFVSLADNVQETFGLTVVQAMACGLPTIVSDWNGYKDTVVSGATGIRIRTFWANCDKQISGLSSVLHREYDHLFLSQSVSVDIEEMVSALHLLVTDRERRRAWGEAGRKRAEELYAWPVVIRQYRDLWDECHARFLDIDSPQWCREDSDAVLSPQFFRRFAHYPSEIIAPETKLGAGATGAELLSQSEPTEEVFLPKVMRHVLPPAGFAALRAKLSELPLTFSTLVADVSAETGHPADLVARQVMWLVKYGVIKCVETTRE